MFTLFWWKTIQIKSKGKEINLIIENKTNNEILADKNCEQMLLDMAYTYTEKYNHRVPPKDAPDLYADFRQDDLETIVESYTVTVDSQNTETPEIAGNATTSVSSITSIVIIAVSVIIAIIAIVIIVVVIIKTT